MPRTYTSTPEPRYVERASHAEDAVALEVSNIKALTPDQCDQLKCGDVVVKDTGTERHSYRVSYKDDTTGEMSLTYVDHSCSEEVYYDKTGGDWAWIVTDITPLGGGGSEVTVNPTLAGTEANVTGIEVDGTKYAMDYLPLSGGTMKVGGGIILPYLSGIKSNEGRMMLDISNDSATMEIGNSYKSAASIVLITGSSGSLQRKKGNTLYDILDTSKGLPVLTTAPSADNTDGIKIVVLSSEPATKYSGYLYIITGA